MSSLKVSIAIATYDGAHYLPAQLASLAAQERLPDELVVCDDGSSDATVAQLEAFAASAPFDVRLFRNTATLGPYRNFEQAAGLCRGDLVFLCDQDDVWLPGKLAAVEALFLESPETAVVINDALLADEQLRSSGHTQFGNIRAGHHPDWLFITGCCSAHRREWQQLALPIPDGSIGHDLWINRLAHELGVARICAGVLQLYRRHGANASEWSASDPAGVSRWKTLLFPGLEDVRDGWQREAQLLTLMIERVTSRREIAQALLGAGLDRRLPELERKLAFVRKRRAFCATPRWRRPIAILSAWTRGDYRHAVGWKSAVKDLIRP